MFSYLPFLLKSTNQHGVHSPFVYNYITKGLYQQNKFKAVQYKTDQLLLQSIQYFKPKVICFLDDSLSAITQKIYTKETIDLFAADLILVRYTLENQEGILQTIKNMNSSQLLLIATYNYSKLFFDELRKNSEITLVVDFYYGCLISKRIEQPKQNFFIRY